MAKQVPRMASADKKAVQAIIGRALTDSKFLQALQRSPAKALAEYKLRAQTVAFIKEGLNLKGELNRVQELIRKIFGDEVKGG